jgi:pyridoxal 5-phosphate dependent beta-lyase
VTSLPAAPLAAAWRAGLADHAVVHLDAAGCACLSRAVLDATVTHLRREAAVGGYAAEAEVAPALGALHTRLGALVDLDGDDVSLAPNATVAFTALLGAWPLPNGARVATVRSDYESNRLALQALAARRAMDVVDLPTDGVGHLDLDALPGQLRGVDLLTFPVVASQRGVVQPAAAAVSQAHDAGVRVILDVAQAAGQVPITQLGADGYVGTSRKWLRGPRGTGWLAAPAAAAARLEPAFPSLVGRDAEGVGRLATGEASVAARVGLAVALDELAAADEEAFARIAALGAYARNRLDGVGGWRAQEPRDEPSGIVTLAHPAEDPVGVAGRLLDEGIATTAIPAGRAPADLDRGVLRISLHAYCQPEDLDRLEFSLRR